MDSATYLELRTQARRLCRRAADAEDLVQDTLVAALTADRTDLPWLMGTLRNLSAMQARTAVRRQRREAGVAREVEEAGVALSTMPASTSAPAWPVAWNTWPASLRRVAILALHGLSPEEIRYLLDLSAEAFRQRVSRLRKLLGQLPPAERAESIALAYQRDPARSVDLQFGLVRRALKAALRGLDGIATHDADGHLLVIHGDCHASPNCGNG